MRCVIKKLNHKIIDIKYFNYLAAVIMTLSEAPYTDNTHFACQAN